MLVSNRADLQNIALFLSYEKICYSTLRAPPVQIGHMIQIILYTSVIEADKERPQPTKLAQASQLGPCSFPIVHIYNVFVHPL